MSDIEKEAVILLYTNACVELHHRFRDGNDHTKEMALCDALEAVYPDVIMSLCETEKLKSA